MSTVLVSLFLVAILAALFLVLYYRRKTTILFTGDLSLDPALYGTKDDDTRYSHPNTPGNRILRNDDPLHSSGIAELLQRADFTVTNLECPVTAHTNPVDKEFNFQCHPQSLWFVKKYFDLVSVANNHVYDYGERGFRDTLSHLDAWGIVHVGGGLTEAQAYSPKIVHLNGLRVAFLAYNLAIIFERDVSIVNDSENKAGVAWMDETQSTPVDLQRFHDAVRRVRPQVDLVVALLHYGKEYIPTCDREQRDVSRMMVDAGVDIVVGTHPHVVQNMEMYRGKPIFYSLGNFIMNGFLDVPLARRGAILEIGVTQQVFTKSIKVEWQLHPIDMDVLGNPHICV